MINNSIIIKKKFEAIVDRKQKINKCYFSNEDPKFILFLCDNLNILEWDVDREYISHIYYDVLGDIYEFKMNCQKNSDIEIDVKNFCILKDEEINVWNSMKYNKKNVLNIKNVNCFSYDFSGLLLYFISKINQKNFIKIIKFNDEFECQEIFNKTLKCFDSKVNIDYLNSFDVNIIMSDTNLGKIYIFKHHPINSLEFEIFINKSQLYFPLAGKNPLFEFKVFCFNLKEDEQNLITFNYNPNSYITEKIKISLSNMYYFKENIKEKALFLVFDDIKKEITQYNI